MTTKGKDAGQPALVGAVKQLVTKKLGCQCPDEVFEKMRFKELEDGVGGWLVMVGGRLMLRLIKVGKEKPTKDELLDVLRSGRMERDRRGFNRFRLLLIVFGPGRALDRWTAQSEKVINEFKGIVNSDDRVHIHVLASDDIPGPVLALLGG